jgi:hypothetical protein
MRPITKKFVASTGILTLVLFAAAADAGRWFNRDGSYETGTGRAGSWSSEGHRWRGGGWREQSVTTQSGRVLNRSQQHQYDPSSGAVTRSVTGWGGRTRDVQGTYTRGSDEYDRTITGANGGSVNATSTFDKENRSVSTSYTGENGRTASRTSIRNGEGGRSSTVTGPQGNTVTHTTTNSYSPQTNTLTHSLTGPSGTHNVTLTP